MDYLNIQTFTPVPLRKRFEAMQDDRPPYRAFIKHLYMATTEHEMVEQMTHLNAVDGLYNVHLIKRGHYDGNKSINAFLSFQTEDQCRAAIEILNGSYLGGLAKYALEADFAVPRKTGSRFFHQPPEQLDQAGDVAEGIPHQQMQQQQQSQDDGWMDNKEPDLRRPVTPPKASETTPPMQPMHHLPAPPLPPPPLQHVPTFPPPRYPLMVPHGYAMPPPMLPMGYMFPPPPPVWVPQPWAPPVNPSADWLGSAKSKAKVPHPEPAEEDGENQKDEELQTWFDDNLKGPVWDDGSGPVEPEEMVVKEKKKLEKTKDKKKDTTKEEPKKKTAKEKEKDKEKKKKVSRSRSRSKGRKAKDVEKEKKTK